MAENTPNQSPVLQSAQMEAGTLTQSVIAKLQSTPTMRRRVLAGLAIPMAWFFMNNYLEAPRGFSMALFWPAFLLVTLWYFRDQILRRDAMTWLTGAAVFAGSIHAALYASGAMNALNFLMLPLLSIFCLLTATRKTRDITLATYLHTLDTLIIKPFLSLIYAIPFLSLPKGFQRSRTRDNGPLREVALGLLIAAPLVLFLLILLTNADAGFSDLVDGFLNGFLLNLTLTSAMTNLMRTLVGLMYFLGVVIGIQLNRKEEEPVIHGLRSQSPTVSLIVLGSVDLLYLVFTLTQLSTLYFPRTALTSLDQGIAHYARSGFFSLLVVLAINLFLLWIIPSMTRRQANLKVAFRLGYILMGLFTANMILSSFYKMNLYEMEYGYTYLRLFVKFALVFFSIGLILSGLFLTGKLKSLLKALTTTALSLFIVLSLLNLDGIIAARSGEIYRSNGRLDIEYLSQLSADAYPALKKTFQLDTSTDPKILQLKKRYTDQLYHEMNDPIFRHQPLAFTLSELRVRP